MKIKFLYWSFLIFLFPNLYTSQIISGNENINDDLSSELLSLRKIVLSDPAATIPKLQELMQKADSKNNGYVSSYCKSVISLAYYSMSDYEKSLQYAKESIEQSEENNFIDIEASSLGIKAMVLTRMNFNTEGKKEINRALAISNKNDPKILEARFKVLSYATQVYNQEDPKTLELSKESFRVATHLQDNTKIAIAATNLGYSYMQVAKNYNDAKKYFNVAIKLTPKDNDYNNMHNLQNMGALYTKIKKPDSAIYYLEKSLNLAKKLKILTTEIEIKENLNRAYSLKKDSSKILNTTSDLHTTENKFQQKVLNSSDKVLESIVQEKTIGVDEKRKKNLLGFIITGILFILLSVFSIIYFLKSKKEKKRFKEIIKNLEAKKTNQLQEITSSINDNFEKKHSFITKETEIELLNKIEKFEKSKKFLHKDMSLNTMAFMLETNITYLSEVINLHKYKNFNQYINELRINYLLQQLNDDPKYRMYKISALAEDIGYVNYNSFVNAFKSITGMSPSRFINLLQSNN